MPLWSQGFKVCVHPPLTDEPRIALEVGDLVNVTRWRRHWLFGEKIQDLPAEPAMNGSKTLNSEENTAGKTRTRGWFPRQSAELFEEYDDSDDEYDNKKKVK